MEIQTITKDGIKNYFIIKKKDDRYSINLSNLTKPIFIKLPFVLNEDVARLVGLMPDGSLIKDLRRIYICE